MNADEMREMSIDEIEEELDDAREEMMRLRFQAVSGELGDTNQLRTGRRKIARLLTILKEKQTAVQEGAE
jgi:large subunit ribosomal protein L29